MENWRQFHEKEDKYKSFYGSDFQYDVKEYTIDEDGLRSSSVFIVGG
tara:strand:- start:143 stop:283 length:141 start_codon:yes stop_codon:yes gene_type:complete